MRPNRPLVQIWVRTCQNDRTRTSFGNPRRSHKCRELARCLAESVLKSNRFRQVYFQRLKLRKYLIDLAGDVIDVRHAINRLQLAFGIVVADQRRCFLVVSL